VVPPLRAVWIPADRPHSVAIWSVDGFDRTDVFSPKLCRKLRGSGLGRTFRRCCERISRHAFGKVQKVEPKESGGGPARGLFRRQ